MHYLQLHYWTPLVLTAVMSLTLLSGCFHHHRHDDDDRVVVPAGYHDRGDWRRHEEWEHDRYHHEHEWDRDRY